MQQPILSLFNAHPNHQPQTAQHRALEACKRANAETAAVVAQHPGRFVGVGLLPTGNMEDPEVRGWACDVMF
jgi:predicted TIM-barrel fold metal-dependent hydrolase